MYVVFKCMYVCFLGKCPHGRCQRPIPFHWSNLTRGNGLRRCPRCGDLGVRAWDYCWLCGRQSTEADRTFDSVNSADVMKDDDDVVFEGLYLPEAGLFPDGSVRGPGSIPLKMSTRGRGGRGGGRGGGVGGTTGVKVVEKKGPMRKKKNTELEKEMEKEEEGEIEKEEEAEEEEEQKTGEEDQPARKKTKED